MMRNGNRRRFILDASALAGAVFVGSRSSRVWAAANRMSIATFRVDVSPPVGHPLCGGWIKPVEGQDDPLEAIGIVLQGVGDPIVLCTVDWTGLLNEAHVRWREVLAQAAETTPERVAVHCVHQHNAPFVCLESQRVCAQFDALRAAVVDPAFFETALQRTAQALRECRTRSQPISHVATGQATVERIAGNRRFVGEDGKVSEWRGSSSKNPLHKELPEGLIDPQLKTVAFFHEDSVVAACHYYATHPMSYYGDGRVSSDFAGLARKRMQAAEPHCAHLYFTGCAGNIAAGKYNDGTPEARRELTDRLHAALLKSMAGLQPRPVERVAWQTEPVLPAVRASFAEDMLQKDIEREDNSLANRIRAAMMLSWLRRSKARVPIVLSALHLDSTSLLHLPAESFIEYQLSAQSLAPDRFVATAAYGDGGPWYLPTREAYPQGGYEVGVAFCEPTVHDVLDQGIGRLIRN